MPPFELRIPPHVAEVLRHLPPDLKRPVKAALRAIGTNPTIGAPLTGALAGLWRFRVRRFRIVYTVDRADRSIRLLAVGHRRQIYDDLQLMLAKEPKEPHPKMKKRQVENTRRSG